jgi:hypothetical protein
MSHDEFWDSPDGRVTRYVARSDYRAWWRDDQTEGEGSGAIAHERSNRRGCRGIRTCLSWRWPWNTFYSLTADFRL